MKTSKWWGQRLNALKSLVVAMELVLAVFAAPVSAQTLSHDAKVQIDEYLRTTVAQTSIPGVVAIVATPTDVIYESAFGYQNTKERIAMRKDSIFRIASMTKPVTSVAVMKLVEDGTVSLDKSITEYLPELAGLRVLDGSPAHSMTVRQLLSNTSGFGYWFCNPDLQRIRRSTEEEKDLLDYPLVHQPGERWTYGCGTRALGQLVEKVSGKKLNEYFAAEILQPAGMMDTGYYVPVSKMSRLVTVHTRKAEGMSEAPNPSKDESEIVGDYGLRSTASDYARFLQIFLNDGRSGNSRILQPASIEHMTSSQIGDLVVQEQPEVVGDVARRFPLGAGHDKFGLGFQIKMHAQPDRTINQELQLGRHLQHSLLGGPRAKNCSGSADANPPFLRR